MDIFIFVKGLKMLTCLLGGHFQRCEWVEERRGGGETVACCLSGIPSTRKASRVPSPCFLLWLPVPRPGTGVFIWGHRAAHLPLPVVVIVWCLTTWAVWTLTGSSILEAQPGGLEWRWWGRSTREKAHLEPKWTYFIFQQPLWAYQSILAECQPCLPVPHAEVKFY